MKTNYPIISWSTNNADVTPPQSGRSDIHGFSDDYFFNILKNSGLGTILHQDCHLDVLCRAIPYEPGMALVDESNGILIDVEIDAPYHGWYRFPMHYTEGKDAVRDRYFNDCGWTVVRFTEQQVHEQADACVELLRRIVATLKGENEVLDGIVQPEQRWTQKEAVEMEKELSREKLLQIQSFGQPEFLPELREKVAENDSRSCRSVHPDIVFNEASHTYADARNQTGTADYTSVTTLIEKFFPFFDEEAYIEHFMTESQQIEYFLKGKPHEEDFKEFQFFLKFHEEQILRRGLEFYDAEKIVTLPQYGIAGTVDALFRKPDGNFVMVDWKRSKNLIIDGYPKKYGTGRGLSILSHLDNSSYYHYELQQSFYKYILETEYGMKVSSMILCVLHPEYDRYYTIKLSDYRVQEVREMVAALISLSIRQ